MTEHVTDVPDNEPGHEAETDENAAASPRWRRRAMVLGSSTLAFAVGGALIGAAAFTASQGLGARAGGASDSLTTNSTQMPGVTGSLCGSTRSTATAADTALSCQNYGLSSFDANAAWAARVTNAMLLAFIRNGAAGATAGATHGTTTKSGSGLPAGGKPGVPGVPGLPGTSGSKATCGATPPPPSGVPTPPSGSVSVTITGGGGKVSVKAGSSGVKVCGTAPKVPTARTTLPSTPATLPVLPGTTTTKKKHHKKHKSPTIQSVVNNVTGGVSGLGSGL